MALMRLHGRVCVCVFLTVVFLYGVAHALKSADGHRSEFAQTPASISCPFCPDQNSSPHITALAHLRHTCQGGGSGSAALKGGAVTKGFILGVKIPHSGKMREGTSGRSLYLDQNHQHLPCPIRILAASLY